MGDATDKLYVGDELQPGALPRSERALAALIIFFYFFARYTVFEYLDSLAWWASYAFEVIFVSGVAWYYRARVRFGFEPGTLFLKHAVGALAAGLTISIAIGYAGVALPFRADDGRTVFLMLNVAPILEEAIFRLALWVPMALLLIQRNGSVLLALNAALFSAVHLHALTGATPEFVPFILVQSLYVIGLAAVCGWWMQRTASLFYPFLIHYLFNLGFYLPHLF